MASINDDIGESIFDEKSEAKFKPLDYGIMKPIGLVTPFVDRQTIEDPGPTPNPIKLSYGTGTVEGNIAKDHMCFGEDQAVCLDEVKFLSVNTAD